MICLFNDHFKTKIATTKWPEEKYAVKIAENLGYRVDGKRVTYKKYLEDFATHIENSTKLAESKAIVEDIAQRFVKVGFPRTPLQFAWYIINYNTNVPCLIFRSRCFIGICMYEKWRRSKSIHQFSIF